MHRLRALVLPVAVVALVVLAGCAAPFPTRTTPASPEPTLVSTTSTGGTCVDDASHDWDVSQRTEDGTTLVEVSGNVTVPDANYALDPPTLERVDEGWFVLDVTSYEEPEKAPRDCDAVAGYTAVVRLPATDGGTLTVRHDGETVTELAWDEEGAGVGSEADGTD